MLKTLHGKISLVLLGMLGLLGLLFFSLTLHTTERYSQEVNQKLNRPLAAGLAAHLAAKRLLSEDPRTLLRARQEIKHLMVINPDIDVYVLDARGNILTYSETPGKLRRDRVALPPLRRFLARAAATPIFGDDPRSRSRVKVFSAAPVALGPPGNGYLYVILGGAEYDSTAGLFQKSYILRSSLWVTAGILALAFGAGLALFSLLTRRLRRLTLAVEQFRDIDVRAAPRDEIDRLGAVYVQMSRRLRGQIQEIAESDERRREMVSNVSHDLRTPLAALQGYLETLLIKEATLTPAQQREYVQSALRHSERLAMLIEDLFEMARLDSREVQVNAEPFSLAELVQDVVQQHGLEAQKNGLRLEAGDGETLPFVHADIGLIQRVLDNLIENAMRYTPPGGAITLTLTQEGDGIRVLVRDTGSGIRPEDLPHIFERFYRVPKQPDKPGCAGLGLAIAKRILELHGTTIHVESVPDQGTTFSFSLPVYSRISE